MKKILFWIMVITCATFVWIIKISLLFIIIMYVAQYTCPQLWGSHSLGNCLYLLDGDDNYRGIIVFTEKERLSGNTSYGGAPIIPFPDIEYNDSIGEDYVVKTSYNKNWIIVQTQFYRTKDYRYYIISKDFDPEKMFEKYKMTNEDSLANKSYKTNFDAFIGRNIRVYSDSTEFAAACKKDNIKLHFESH